MRLSVIVCTYNLGHLLPDALRTLAAQTFTDFELLIVDDGSSDNTEEVVQKFVPSFRNARYLRKTHTGLADSRNVGLQAATGTHIAWLDADDLWSPDYLRCMRQALETNPQADIVCCDGFKFQGAGTVIGPLFPRGFPHLSGPPNSGRDLFFLVCYTLPSGMVVSKATYDRIGPVDPRFRIGLDGHWMIRAALKGIFCVVLNRKLVLYRRHESNLTKQTARSFEEWLEIYVDTLKQSTDAGIQAQAKRFTMSFALGMMAQCSSTKARQLLGRAVEVFEDDPVLKAAYASTYFGVPSLLRFARATKHLFREPAWRLARVFRRVR
jgi:glycosyltransferase involved in cell wall biosynthesis